MQADVPEGRRLVMVHNEISWSNGSVPARLQRTSDGREPGALLVTIATTCGRAGHGKS